MTNCIKNRFKAIFQKNILKFKNIIVILQYNMRTIKPHKHNIEIQGIYSIQEL